MAEYLEHYVAPRSSFAARHARHTSVRSRGLENDTLKKSASACVAERRLYRASMGEALVMGRNDEVVVVEARK
jgi:hypothetical protein